MNHAQIDALVKEFNIDTAEGPVNARVQQVVVRLVSDLFKAIEDLGYRIGFQHVASGPMVRSSYHADEMAHAAGVVQVA